MTHAYEDDVITAFDILLEQVEEAIAALKQDSMSAFEGWRNTAVGA